MNLKQGDIVLVPFPFTDGQHSKVRPAIVISSDRVNQTQDVILAQVSSNIRNDGFSFSLDREMLDSPLARESEVRIHKVFVIERRLVKKVIARLKQDHCLKLIQQIKGLFDY
ncbi:type II toxin-antitoxin system PemK/MazF family toxin [Fontibacter flavus]|uniref:Type II toxin-antitoxin system PemK/MazF family toxin n=1 Tax=Fontibacter flavus TaxID=654838 RepID=A0ABV6FVM0_9BACT